MLILGDYDGLYYYSCSVDGAGGKHKLIDSFNGYSEERQMNTFFGETISDFILGIDGNRMNERMRFEIYPKRNEVDDKIFKDQCYSDEFIIDCLL